MNSYLVRTFGCQMNKHDSERVAGMFDALGWTSTEDAEDADLIVFLTCCVREKADERLYGSVTSLHGIKERNPGLLVAVGGCIGQRDGEDLLGRLVDVDVVFGTHNLAELPHLVQTARDGDARIARVLDEGEGFATDLPGTREHPWHAWVPIMVGCNNFCTYCIVPHVRGRERSRPADDVLAEVSRLVDDGVREITLLGQNVNSYGRDLHGDPSFHTLLARVAETGIERIRFATSHPKDLSDDTIAVMASTPTICDSLHLPFQSGSDRILAAMNRTYTSAAYLERVDALRAAIPGLALSTDIIVGFPGETEDDFAATLDLVNRVGFDQAFTFIYSPRDGTPAATMADAVDREVAQERFERLVTAVNEWARRRNDPMVGTVQRVLLEGVSKRDGSVLSGRTEHNKVVHAPIPGLGDGREMSGRFVDVLIESASTWYLSGTVLREHEGG